MLISATGLYKRFRSANRIVARYSLPRRTTPVRLGRCVPGASRFIRSEAFIHSRSANRIVARYSLPRRTTPVRLGRCVPGASRFIRSEAFIHSRSANRFKARIRSAAFIRPGSANSSAGGFTLIEILIVLVILALVAGLISLNLAPDPRADLRRQAQALTGALEYAADRARWRHELLGLAQLPNGAGWQFLLIDTSTGEQSAATIDDDRELRPHLLPEGMHYRPLFYGGAEAAAETVLPILPSGRFEPYEVQLAMEDWQVVLSCDPLGRISVSEVGMKP